ncbi:MAG: hypothetical protein G3H99_04635 [Ferrovum sp.]|jgi:hypothetical protein|nr:hypothetical protein [Ferrovum sp.]NDU88024.1 hypothetical protein [Ferrovum sp.]
MSEIETLARFIVPLGQQVIDVLEITHVENGMPLLRLRIREGKRFTIFDIDPITATQLGEVMTRWGLKQDDHKT